MKEGMSYLDLRTYIAAGRPVITLLQAWKDEDDPTHTKQTSMMDTTLWQLDMITITYTLRTLGFTAVLVTYQTNS